MNKRSGKKLTAKGSPVARAIKKLAPLPLDFLQALRLREWSAMEALQKGMGTPFDVALMTEMLWMCEASVELGIGPEAKQACEQAEKVLDRIDDGQSLIKLDASQMKIIRDLHDFHDQQREVCSFSEYEQLVRLVDVKMQDKLS